eukprot:TRINITY_DN463_c0_g1_i3.p3 TRINITY_DN463_c0_g1~~TRINITY_DN463_c0_g1_i3.p3  ORF type:complete len:50 (-),score=2.71 TRINITY_DN463_c0_g1_i3:280-429(-)
MPNAREEQVVPSFHAGPKSGIFSHFSKYQYSEPVYPSIFYNEMADEIFE